MDDYSMQQRIREILQGKIAMGAGAKRKRRTRKSRGGDYNSYFEYVRRWMIENPGYTWKEAVELASPSYRSLSGAGLLVDDDYYAAGYATNSGIGAGRKRYTEALEQLEHLRDADIHMGGYGTSAGARKAWRTRRRNMKNYGSGVLVGGYGTSAGAKKGWATRKRNLRSGSKRTRSSTRKY